MLLGIDMANIKCYKRIYTDENGDKYRSDEIHYSIEPKTLILRSPRLVDGEVDISRGRKITRSLRGYIIEKNDIQVGDQILYKGQKFVIANIDIKPNALAPNLMIKIIKAE